MNKLFTLLFVILLVIVVSAKEEKHRPFRYPLINRIAH